MRKFIVVFALVLATFTTLGVNNLDVEKQQKLVANDLPGAEWPICDSPLPGIDGAEWPVCG